MDMTDAFGLCQNIETNIVLINYGNHCGAEGKHEEGPIDEIDKCCMHHDRCWTLVDK